MAGAVRPAERTALRRESRRDVGQTCQQPATTSELSSAYDRPFLGKHRRVVCVCVRLCLCVYVYGVDTCVL